MITKEIFPVTERRDLSKILADRKSIDIQTYLKCLSALELAESHINEFYNHRGISSHFIEFSESSQSTQLDD